MSAAGRPRERQLAGRRWAWGAAPPRGCGLTLRGPRTQTVLVLAAFVAVLVVARVWGEAILASGQVIRLGAPPLVGWDRWRPSWRVGASVLVGLLAVVAAPKAAARMSWRTLLVASGVLAAVWALALAFVDGTAGITYPTVLPGDEYLLDVPRVAALGPGDFLATFTERIDDYVTHVRSHPPGLLLGLWALDVVGLGGKWPTALAMVGIGASAVPAVLITLRNLADEAVARRAAPFVAVAPAAIWVAVSADALFAGVAAWSVVALTLATDDRARRAPPGRLRRSGGPGGTASARARGGPTWADHDRRSDLLALAAGLGFGVGLHLSYGIALFGLLPAVIVWCRRRWRPVLVAAGGVVAVTVAFVAGGFWLIDGALTTRGEYAESVASTRPYRYFVVSNVAALFLALGPAAVVGLSRLRDRRVWLVVGAALAAGVISNLSGLTKGEVERIWLPFTVWLLAGGLALWRGGDDRRAARGWLALQVACTIALTVTVYTRW